MCEINMYERSYHPAEIGGSPGHDVRDLVLYDMIERYREHTMYELFARILRWIEDFRASFTWNGELTSQLVTRVTLLERRIQQLENQSNVRSDLL